MSLSGTSTTTISGGNINSLWPDLKESMEEMNETDGVTVTFNDTNHSYTMTWNNFSQTMTDDGLAGVGFLINQNGTKIKIPTGGVNEVIYTKQ
jgi:hypothetical protein